MKPIKKIEIITDWLGSGSINIFGMPFAGKDTHGLELAKLLNGSFISSGDILRSHGHIHVKRHIAKGNLAPTETFRETVLPFLSQNQFAGRPLILSSVGRWHGEETSVMQAAHAAGHPLKAVLYLNITEHEAEKRWLQSERGRDDDAEHHILLNRFEEFKEKTLPVVDFYRKKGLLIEINGVPTQTIVTEDILAQLAVRASRA